MNVDEFKNKRILVVGDIMIDKTIWGDVSRISPDAPVPVVNVTKETITLGGAANAANNIASLGGTALILGIIGNDDPEHLIKELQAKNIQNSLVVDPSRPTTEKVRVVSQGQQLIRVDYEKKHPADANTINKIMQEFDKLLDDVDGIIISDYAKGINSEELMQHIITKAKGKIIVIDSKSKNIDIYKNATVITPNHIDASNITGIEENSEEDTIRIGKVLQEKLNANVLMTRGSKGMTIFEGDNVENIGTKAQEVYDVTGAGDTVVAALTLSLCCGSSLKEAAEIATSAAAVVIRKVGTATVSHDELVKELG